MARGIRCVMKTFYSHLDFWGRGTITHLFTHQYDLKEVRDPADADIIVWNGGEDIGTSIYGERPIGRGIPYKESQRDTEEIELFNRFKGNHGKLLVGICRGAQLLNCLNGGKLYQDVNNHGRSHPMVDRRSGEILDVTSTHHQQMIPALKDGQVIGVSSCSSVKHSEEGMTHHEKAHGIKNGVDVEIMWYPKTHSLCIQGHPEYVPTSRFAAYTLELLNEFWAEITKTKAA